MKQSLSTCLFVIFCCCATVTAAETLADEIKIPIGTQNPQLQPLERPLQGATQVQVKQQFGAPIRVISAPGTPAIVRWEYAEFTVYFESDRVIHSVLKARLHEPSVIIVEPPDEP